MERKKERKEESGEWACNHLKLWYAMGYKWVLNKLRSPWINYKLLYKICLKIHCVMHVGILSLTEEITVFWQRELEVPTSTTCCVYWRLMVKLIMDVCHK